MIHQATISDVRIVSELACMLWEGDTTERIEEFTDLLSRDDCAVFLDIEDELPVGFAQCQLRCDYVEGTDTSPVGYLEGIFVRKEYRHQGRARALLAACENWSAAQGCTEFASDCELDNIDSLTFHLHAGFIEANRIICFTKQLVKK